MNIRRIIVAGTLIFVCVVTAIAYDFNTQASITNPSLADGSPSGDPASHEERLIPGPMPGQPTRSVSGVPTLTETAGYEEYVLPPFVFQREGATSPEDAAKSLFHACAAESPKHFVQHLLLGVCDGPIDTLQKFAECLHSTRFHHGEDSFTVYDLPFGKGIDPEKSFRAVASQDFDSESKQVAALQFQMMSTYYGEQFKSVDVAAESYDGLEYRTRIVVALVKDRWYAMPRCRSSKSFYEIADAMRLASPESKEAE